MWSRKVIKEKAKAHVHSNYWKMVLVGLILALLTGGASGSTSGFNRGDDDTNISMDQDFDDYVDDFVTDLNPFMQKGDIDPQYSRDFGFLMASLGIIVAFIMAFGVVLGIFIFNPLVVGGKRFFYKNIKEQAKFGEVGYCFDHNYLNHVKTMFLKQLFIFLWSLLFVIPGIIKSYEYRMIPFLLGENPDMSSDEAFAISKRMMDGNKWDAFVFDLSFIGWRILGGITFGLVDLFYVNPYYYQADAMLYDAIKIDDNTRTQSYQQGTYSTDTTTTFSAETFAGDTTETIVETTTVEETTVENTTENNSDQN